MSASQPHDIRQTQGDETARRLGPVRGTAVQVTAKAILPGDYLPPQPLLHGTAWQESGFRTGGRPDAVRVNLPVLSGRVLLFGPLGVLDSLRNADQVVVVRDGAPG